MPDSPPSVPSGAMRLSDGFWYTHTYGLLVTHRDNWPMHLCIPNITHRAILSPGGSGRKDYYVLIGASVYHPKEGGQGSICHLYLPFTDTFENPTYKDESIFTPRSIRPLTVEETIRCGACNAVFRIE